MTFRLLCPIMLFIGAAAPLAAQPRPPAFSDPRHQEILYDPNRVVEIQGMPGFQLTIEFAPDEIIENVAVGDSGAWQVTPNRSSDHLFVKPIQPGVTTNMTVLTSVRTYTFDLKPLTGPLSQMPYTLRFKYPDEKPSIDAAPGPADIGRYQLSGARALLPSAISDDGKHTYIQWAKGRDLPAVYAVSADGREALVNGAMRDEIFVIDSIESRLAFRIDKQVARADRVAGAAPK